jgi:hypothetical protein
MYTHPSYYSLRQSSSRKEGGSMVRKGDFSTWRSLMPQPERKRPFSLLRQSGKILRPMVAHIIVWIGGTKGVSSTSPHVLPTCSMSIGGLICSRSNRIRWHSSVDGALSSSQPVTCPVHIAARRSPARRVMPVILMSSGHWDSIPHANDHPSLWHLYPKVLNAGNVAIVGKTSRNVCNAG